MGADCCIEWRLSLDRVYLDAGLLSPYNTAQYNTVPSLWRSRPPDTTVWYSLHASQLWNNAALYEWATVRKISGMALKCRLEYSASLSGASCFTLLWFSTTSSLDGRLQVSNPCTKHPNYEKERPWSQVFSSFCGIFISQNPPPKKSSHPFHVQIIRPCFQIHQESRGGQGSTWVLVSPVVAAPALWCAALPVPAITESEKGEECPIYEFCPIQWHIVTRKPQRTIPIQKG